MRILAVLVFISIQFTIQAQEIKLTLPVKFLALGDSYTIGQSVAESERWPVQLVDELQKNSFATEELKIIAQTGWRTDNLISAIRAENLNSNYNLVSLLIGVNNQYQGSDFAQYEREFAELLNMAIGLAGGDKESVFVLSIPDYGYTPFGESNRIAISAEIDKYNRANKAIALQYGVAYINITRISREGLVKPELVASDGLHPSGEMYAEWVELIYQAMFLGQTSNVYPNKTDGKFTIRFQAGNNNLYVDWPTSLKNEAVFNISSISGIKVKTGKLTGNEISLKGLKSGLYLLELVYAEHKKSAKFIIP